MKSIDTLAARYGIADSFIDARGERQTSSLETRQRLLAAMGVPVAGEQEAHDALEALDRLEWFQPLSPTSVVLAGDAFDVPVTLPADTDQVAWQLTLEDGRDMSGHEKFHSMPLIERKVVDHAVLERRSLRLAGKIPWGYHT
jgi:hypothetical protein